VDEALSRLEVTRVVSSHRLSAIRNADQILVLHQGSIAARGRHDDLVAPEGIYGDLFGDAAAAPPRRQPAERPSGLHAV
jgi:ABC-type multidrug transport system fused ATPase/permease subunit